jgi:hypothetical protein
MAQLAVGRNRITQGETIMTFTLFTPGQAFSVCDMMAGRPVALATADGTHTTAARTLAELDMDRGGIILRYADGTMQRPAAGERIAVGSHA